MATKKFDDTCLIFDWELLDHLSEPPSLKNYDAALITFLQLINSLHTGENKINGLEKKIIKPVLSFNSKPFSQSRFRLN